MNLDHIPDLHWNLANTYHTTSIGHTDTQTTVVSGPYIDVETLSCAREDKCGNQCGTTLNTDTSTSQSQLGENHLFYILPFN